MIGYKRYIEVLINDHIIKAYKSVLYGNNNQFLN